MGSIDEAIHNAKEKTLDSRFMDFQRKMFTDGMKGHWDNRFDLVWDMIVENVGLPTERQNILEH